MLLSGSRLATSVRGKLMSRRIHRIPHRSYDTAVEGSLLSHRISKDEEAALNLLAAPGETATGYPAPFDYCRRSVRHTALQNPRNMYSAGFANDTRGVCWIKNENKVRCSRVSVAFWPVAPTATPDPVPERTLSSTALCGLGLPLPGSI